MSVFESHSTEQTEKIAESFAAGLKGGEVLAFFGGLGAGKTAFVRGLARGLGVTTEVTSPTFALMNEYEGKMPLYHFDMYRISGFEDLYSTGFFDFLGTKSIIAAEWSENIESVLPEGFIKIEISRGQNENDRIIEINENTCG